jgi:hypothetical protein
VLAKDLVLNLNRPEYVPYSEHFISDLLWSAATVPGWSNSDAASYDSSKSILGLIYDAEGQTSKKIHLITTRPERGDERWVSALRLSGVLVDNNEEKVAAAISDALFGIRSAGAKRRPITPVTPVAALLQNRYGVFMKAGPPDVAGIIEQMYRLGALGSSESSVGSSDLAVMRLHDAFNLRLQRDPFLASLNSAIAGGILPTGAAPEVDYTRVVDSGGSEASGILGSQTPFSWFRASWQALTSEEWVCALSARRWIDWATTVLRIAYGFGYLWEMRWYDTLARSIVQSQGNVSDRSIEDVLSVVSATGTLLWVDSQHPISERDIASSTRNLIARGVAIRGVLSDSIGASEVSATEFLRTAGLDTELVDRLKDALNPKFASAANNLWEAIKYTLMGRDSEGDFADHYGFLKTYGRRFTVIDPATEWIAVVVSLSCGSPGRKSNLGTIQDSLRSLGLAPGLRELSTRLEMAGLSRSTPDADVGMFVEPAF